MSGGGLPQQYSMFWHLRMKGIVMSTGKRLSTEEKKEIFSHLVATQDEVHNVRKSYELVTDHFDISEEQLKAVQEEGLEHEWPPLSEPVAVA
ncbi:MAG: hypothetical protein EXS16_06485 [Gemmataceae bacterium]|nr:hypothetical protein [Gemmataceae bacterium]